VIPKTSSIRQRCQDRVTGGEIAGPAGAAASVCHAGGLPVTDPVELAAKLRRLG
jgi:hypothetical protein